MSRARLRWLYSFVPLSCLGLFSFAEIASAQLQPQETVQTLTVPEGFEVKLFASEPMIANPIALDVDTRGRVWVTEGVNYRRNVANPPDNKIKVLEDTDGDGVADKVTVFTSDLNAAMGVCVAGSKVYVPESPNLYVYEDKDGDLVADGPRQTLLTGFGGKNHDHGVHSQFFGPDHKLYMTNGDTGFDVTGPDGSHIQFKWGAMIRSEGDGSKLEAIAVNFRNPFELGVDSFGNVWCSDNDNDGLKSVRICWILEGGNYGWFGGPEMIRNPDGSFDPIHHWRADKPGFVPYVLITGFGSPCGMTFYEGNAFGPEYRGKIFHCDAGPREVRSYSPQKLKGVGYGAGVQNIITSSDNYFRPDDVCAAPDGSLYVNDWYDGGVGGHAYNDPTRGRIYRLTPKGGKLTRTDKPGPYTADGDALVALASPNHATTFLAREQLLKSGEKAVPALTKLAQGDDAILQARALWLLDRIGGAGRKPVVEQLGSKVDVLRALAVRILRRHGNEYESQILALADDKSSEVITEVLLALPQFKTDAATATLLKLYGTYDGSDRYLLETLAIATKGREEAVFKQVVDRPDAVVNARLVNLVRILKPETASAYLSGKLASSNLPEGSQVALLAALSSVATPEAGKSVAALLTQKAPLEIRRLALGALRQNLGGAWSGLKTDEALPAAIKAGLADPDLAPEALALIGTAGLQQFAPEVVKVLGDKESSDVMRLAAIDVAGRLSLGAAAPALAKLLTSDKPALREAALAALVATRDPKTLTTVLTAADPPEIVQQLVADRLSLTSDGAILLLRLIETKKLKPALAKHVIASSIEHPDVNVRILFEKFVPESERPRTLGQSFKSDDILALKGDLARGEAVFLRSGAASCNKCHRVKGKGSDIGPDLSQIGRKYERAALLETIMQPSKGIAPEYIPHVVETKEGKVFAGFVLQDNDQDLTLKTIEGTQVQIPKANIEEVVKQTVSLMPELVLKNVTAQDAADLLAYLVSLQSAEVYATTFKAVGPFPNDKPDDRKLDFGPEAKADRIDDAARFKGLGGNEVGWQTVNSTVVGDVLPQVDLNRVTSAAKVRADHVIYYFAVIVDSTAAQPATLKVGSDDGVQAWLNGAKVHDNAANRAITVGEDQVKVDLKQGPNLVLLKLDQGGGSGGISLSVEARNNVTLRLP